MEIPVNFQIETEIEIPKKMLHDKYAKCHKNNIF